MERITTSELLEKVESTSDERESYDEYPGDWEFVLVDNRSEEEYNQGHINGAINIPAEEEFTHELLPENLDKKLIFYGQDAHDCIAQAQEEGYENIKLYEPTLEAWRSESGYLATTPDYVSALLDEDYAGDAETEPYLIVDTRGFATYLESHVPTAQSMGHTIFEDKYLDALPSDKTVEIITYCGGFF